ncbi:TetR/AcrR family transcriptional regulator [Fulvivirga lutimaris]|uniref:TetR/AcrR family transcriptional regulator n=1 Tax=Fulvivirga lutimaris TaxID=1819566 RepID=UPI0012BD0C88|nr:TetR/AcrR family transcriptional regulator [Fulvivirga lutimaris]MTI40620.1 TetR/AcrR family transcriptional regulator [Fulvivirga lutimaris]
MEASIRETKSAKIKIDILNATLNLVGKKSFKDLYVDDICEKVDVSKVTFFKYFPQKEDILLYYLRVWCLDRVVELDQQNREGLDGVHYLFDKMAIAYERHPGLILSLISYLTSLQRPPAPFPLKTVEREILHPSLMADKVELLSLQQMMEKFLLEAVFKSQITTKSDTKELALVFMTLMYGSIVMAHLRQVSPINVLFKRNINNLLKGLTN